MNDRNKNELDDWYIVLGGKTFVGNPRTDFLTPVDVYGLPEEVTLDPVYELGVATREGKLSLVTSPPFYLISIRKLRVRPMAMFPIADMSRDEKRILRECIRETEDLILKTRAKQSNIVLPGQG